MKHEVTITVRRQSSGWGQVKVRQKKAKTVPSAGKIMATVFSDSHGVVLIDYLEDGKTIIGDYYESQLDDFQNAIKIKRPHLANISFNYLL